MNIDWSKPLVIMSAAFKEVFLHMDGRGITASNGSGAGKVNCQKILTEACAFKAKNVKDNVFTFESVIYPNVFLRMDGGNVKVKTGSGAGKVNCQYGAQEWERFKLHKQQDGSYTIESEAFPNVYLRMDGNNPEGKDKDFGVVNCQFTAASYERFYICNMPGPGMVGKFLEGLRK